MTSKPSLLLEDVVFRYAGGVTALDHLSLDVESGEFVTCVGATGSGKTTLLRLLTGLERPTQGRVTVFGQAIADIPPRERMIGFIAQSGSTYPGSTVLDNVLAPMRARNARADGLQGRALTILERFDLGAMAKRRASTLSGGELQKLALAKLLGWSPRILCLDEPLASIDAASRPDFIELLRKTQRELGATAVYVTHSASEALSLGDRVLVLSHGRALQYDSPEAVCQRPAHMDVLRTLSHQPVSFLPVSVGRVNDQVGTLRIGPREIQVAGLGSNSIAGHSSAVLSVLPDHTVISELGAAGIRAQVKVSEFRGSRYWLHSDSDIGHICLESQKRASAGEVVTFAFREVPMSVFDASSGVLLGEVVVTGSGH